MAGEVGFDATTEPRRAGDESKSIDGSLRPHPSSSVMAAAARAEASVAAWRSESPFKPKRALSAVPPPGMDDDLDLEKQYSRPSPKELRREKDRRRRANWVWAMALLSVVAAAAVISWVSVSELLKERKQQKRAVQGDLESLSILAHDLGTKVSNLQTTVDPLSRRMDRLGNDTSELKAAVGQDLRNVKNVTDRIITLSTTVDTMTKNAQAESDLNKKSRDDVTALKAQLAALQAQAGVVAKTEAKLLASCVAMQEKLASAETLRTAIICEAQAGWTLPCPDDGTPTVTSALYGRFTADGACVDRGTPASWAVCPRSVDLTAQVRAAVSEDGPITKTPKALATASPFADPCPTAYHQLQVLYRCRADAASREKACRDILGITSGAAPAATPAAAAATVAAAAAPDVTPGPLGGKGT